MVRLAAIAGAASLNVAVGVGLAAGRTALAAAVVAVPALVVGLGALAASTRGVLVFAALALEFTADPVNNGLELPGGGDVTIFAADVLALLAVVSWAAARLVTPQERRPGTLHTGVLGWPLVLLAVGLVIGLVRGGDLYGASLLGMPLRLAIYAGIACAMTDLTPRDAYRGIVAVFYVGTVWQSLVGAYYLATGTSATSSLELSTGGTRFLGITIATYLAGALVLALLNLRLDRRVRWRALHLFIAALATFGVTIAFTRAVFLALAIIVPVLLLGSRRLRGALLAYVPVLVPLVVLAALVVPLVAPELVSTLESRLTSSPGTDSSVDWRDRAYEVALRGVDEQPVLGVGFGRQSTFYVDGQRNLIEGDPHNGFLYLLAGGGVLTLGAFLILIAFYLRDAWRRLLSARDRTERSLVVWAVSTWFIFLLHAVVEPVLTYPSMILTIWILMLLPALVPLRERRSGSSRPVGEQVPVDGADPLPAAYRPRIGGRSAA